MENFEKQAVKITCAIFGGIAGFGIGMIAGPVMMAGVAAYHSYKMGDTIHEAIIMKRNATNTPTP
jgi:hypothetical protein